MTKLNLTECALLEVSGELSNSSREHLCDYLASHPRAQKEFDDIEEQFGLLRSLAVVQLSSAELRRIPADIKMGIHAELDRRVRAKQAERRWKFISYALSGLSAAAAVIVVGGVIMINHSVVQRNQQEKMVGLERATEHLALYRDQNSPEDTALTNVQASVNQLQSEGPTLVAGLDNTEMTNVLNVLTAPPPIDDTEMERP
jgi:anti-sigma factor RsiW